MRAPSASRSIRTSPTADSSSVCIPLDPNSVHAFGLDDSGDRNHFPTAHHEGPRFALGAGDLGVDEHVLDLLAPAGEPVARPPATYLKACQLGLDRPSAPANRAVERDRAAFEPRPVVLSDELDAVAEIEPLRADRRSDQLRNGRLQRWPSLERSQEVRGRGRMKLPQERQDLLADHSAGRVAVAAIRAVLEPVRAAVRLGLLAPERQQRAHDTVLALRLDPGRFPAGDEAVEDGLDLVRRRMPRGAEPI